jgi:adenylate cyclase
MAARLEACNKELGSAICVGPSAAARCDAALLRPLGQLSVRGRAEPITVFEPWPSDAPSAWREAYLAAYAMLDHDADHAATLFQKLIEERPLDWTVRRLAERLSPMHKSGSLQISPKGTPGARGQG